jgi:hypothetical protein
MGLYIQKISLIPFSTVELWVGWDLEGVEGEIPGLVAVGGMDEQELRARGVRRFQHIPEKYLTDLDLRPQPPWLRG